MNFDAEYFKDKRKISHEVLTEVEKALPYIVGKMVLDVACGVGRHGYILEYYGYKVTYFDISEDALNGIWWNDNKICGDFISYDFGGRKWDTVISFHFIEHLNDDELRTALKKMKSLARHRVINVTPHPRHEEYNNDPTHVERSFEELLNIYFSVFPETKIIMYDNKHREGIISYIKAPLEILARRFTNIMFVSSV